VSVVVIMGRSGSYGEEGEQGSTGDSVSQGLPSTPQAEAARTPR
jgi:hypothetical protein